ncbi:MAG: protein kinase [Kofleriaceae bacterium]
MAAGETDDTLAGIVTVAGSALPDGTELVAGRYRIVRWLGGGGMGRVYEAIDTELDERIALKVLRPGMSEDSIERFRREVKLTRRIQHRNVARMFDIGEHNGEKFLTMELVSGEALKPGAAPMRWSQLKLIAEQICAGLAAAHATGVVHRDLKPDNILLEAGTGRAVITDFGIARAAEDPSVTQVGAVIGTPRYMSPEQLAGREVDLRSDLFSLGVMLFELATGERPWAGDNAIAVAVAQATSEPREMDTQTTELPPTFGEIIAACLSLEPEHRPASASDVGLAIASGTSGLFAPPTLDTRPVKGVPRRDDPRGREQTTPPPHAQPTSLAVLPIQCGPSDAYLADGMREDLTDTLSTTAGLRVRPAGHIQMTPATDPRSIGRDLGVEHVVVSTLRRSPSGLRIAARLINVSDGFQIWAHKSECAEAEILAEAERVARGIATALSTRAAEATRPTDPRAVEHYLRARAEMRHFWGRHMHAAAEHLERAVDYAPTSAPILGAYALAAVQAWVMSSNPASADRARKALDRALPLGHGEAYLAAASYWSNQGDPERGAQNLGIALVRAPMSAFAHELAGRIAVEVEGLEAARHHFETAIGLDPGRALIITADLARLEALSGQWDAADLRVQALLADADPSMVQLGWVMQARLSAWRGRAPEMLTAANHFAPKLGEGASKIAQFMTELAETGAVDPDAWKRFLAMFGGADQPIRQQLMGLQLLTEGALNFDRTEIALDTLATAAQRGLMDRVWIDHCPLFVKLQKLPRFITTRDHVANRAAKVLSAFRSTQTG